MYGNISGIRWSFIGLHIGLLLYIYICMYMICNGITNGALTGIRLEFQKIYVEHYIVLNKNSWDYIVDNIYIYVQIYKYRYIDI